MSAAVPRPRLIVVSGPPGSGKTQLAHAIAAAIRCPATSRDEIKEGMFATVADSEPASDDPLTVRTFGVLFEVLRILLEADTPHDHERPGADVAPGRMSAANFLEYLVC